ncbi:MAG: hypothetical protein K8U57_06915 [Planctomycetes bacterium]|nr:hypothetical protein [Planctomycetota bacterium]
MPVHIRPRLLVLLTASLMGFLFLTGCNPGGANVPDARDNPDPATPEPIPTPTPEEAITGTSPPTDEPAPSALIAMYPALRAAAVPKIIAPGFRVTYHTSAGSGISGFSILTDEPIRVDQIPVIPSGQAEAGYAQVNVVALDQDAAVLEVRNYLILTARPEAPVLAGGPGFVTAPAVGGGYWVNPEALRRALARSGPNALVQRMNWQTIHTGKTYRVIGVSYRRPGLNYVNLYDEETGLLVLFSTFSERRDTGGRYHQAIARTELVDHRVVAYPWLGQEPPEWLAGVRRMEFRGTVTAPSTMPGRPDYVRPSEGRADVTHRGVDWLRCTVTSSTGGSPGSIGTGVLVCGPAQFDGLWLPPAGLRKLRTGQVIDRDPYTKMEVSVSRVGRDADGRDTVVLTSANPLQRFDETYDRETGMQLASERLDKYLQNLRTRLTLVRVE